MPDPITPTNPTILIVHGSWHTPIHFIPLTQHLTKSNFSSIVTPNLASETGTPQTGLHDDANIIQAELHRLIAQESRTVIVVGHSYGCVVLTQSVLEEFSYSHRQKQGKKGGVIHLVYLCGFIIEKGASLGSTFGGSLPPWIEMDENGMATPTNPAHHFYHDLPADQQKHWVNQLVPNHGRPQFEPLTHAAYLYHPTTYLYCENDQALPYEYQKMMVQKVREATGVAIAEETCGASHSPFLSMPQVLVELLQKLSGGS